jgi:DNA-binding transcriptional regulator YiaG
MYERIGKQGNDTVRLDICRRLKKLEVTHAELCARTEIDTTSMSRWHREEIHLGVIELAKIWQAMFEIRKIRRESNKCAHIRSLRVELGLTQKDVAKLSHLSQGIVSRAESGSRVPETKIKRIVGTLSAEKDRRSNGIPR